MLWKGEVRKAERPERQGRGLFSGPDQEMSRERQEASVRGLGGKALPEVVMADIKAQGLVKRFGAVTAVAGSDTARGGCRSINGWTHDEIDFADSRRVGIVQASR